MLNQNWVNISFTITEKIGNSDWRGVCIAVARIGPTPSSLLGTTIETAAIIH